MSKEELETRLLDWMNRILFPLNTLLGVIEHPSRGMQDGWYGYWVRVRTPLQATGKADVPPRQTKFAQELVKHGWQLRECAMTRKLRRQYKDNFVPVRKKIPDELRLAWEVLHGANNNH